MLIWNMPQFTGIDLYECGKNEETDLVMHGFTPIYREKDKYYFLLDSELRDYLSICESKEEYNKS